MDRQTAIRSTPLRDLLPVRSLNDLDWFEITNILREFIRGFLMSDEKLFIGHPMAKSHIPAEALEQRQAKPAATAIAPKETVILPADPEADQKIISILDEYVRPAVEGDGGAIHFRSFENGIVSVELKGACSGCPSSTVTLKSGIENLLKQMVPGVEEVVAVAE